MISEHRMISDHRMICDHRMISERFWTILKKTAKKNKIGNFPTKITKKITVNHQCLARTKV